MFDTIKKFFVTKPLQGKPQLHRLQSLDGTPVPGALYLEQWGNLTHGLTPNKLRGILNAADMGDISAQQKLFTDMEESCEHLFGEMGKRKRALLSVDYDILPGKAKDKKAEDIAKKIRDLFELLPYFDDIIIDMADAIGHGFSALELEWDYSEGVFLPKALHFRPQEWFMTPTENRNCLRLRDGSAHGAELWPFGWIIHKHKSKSGWLPRYGLFRTLAWAYCIRQYALDCNITYTQVHGLPLRLGKYPPGSDDNDKKALMQALRHLGRDAAGIIPEGMMVEFQSAATTTQDVPGMLVDRCEKGMSKAILGGTLTSQADGQTSTNALGNIHNAVRHEILASDAVQLAATLTEQLILPLCYLNFGITERKYVPYFRFDTKEAEDLAMFAEALPKLVPVMDISKAWAHEKLKIPMAEKEEDILGGVKEIQKEEQPQEEPKEPPAKDADNSSDNNSDKEEKAKLALAKNSTEDALQETPTALMGASASLTAVVLDAVKDGLTPQALESKLAELYADMDESHMAQILARAAFVAEVMGRLDE